MPHYDEEMRAVREWTERLMQLVAECLGGETQSAQLFDEMDAHYGSEDAEEAIDDIKNILLGFNNLCYIGREKLSIATIQRDNYEIETYVKDLQEEIAYFPAQKKLEASSLIAKIESAYRKIAKEVMALQNGKGD